MVDDSEDDRYFLKKALRRFPRFRLLRELCDGQEAVSYLAGHGRFARRDLYPLPDLVVLDLNMPGMCGQDVLRWLQTQNFPSLTVVVLSDSIAREVVQTCLAIGAHGYWSKTTVPEELRQIVFEMQGLLDQRSSSNPAVQKADA